MKPNASQILLWLTFALLASWPTGDLCAQFVDYERLLDHLQIEINLGNPKALRDLGSLLNNEEAKNRAQELMVNHTLFTTEEMNFSHSVSRQKILDFFYTNQKAFKHSQLLNAFYLTPIESQVAPYELKNPKREEPRDLSTQLRKLTLRFEAFIATGDEKAAIKTIQRIGELQTVEGYKYLVDVLFQNRLLLGSFENAELVIQEICYVLIDYPTNKTLTTVLQLIENKLITPEFASPILEKLTNISVVEDKNYSALEKRYEYWLDSLGTVEKMREFGYGMVFNFKKSFFQFPVDYYGKILSQANRYTWIRHNARKDIVATQHSRALFYLAALLYKYRNDAQKSEEFEDILLELKQLTKLDVAVEGADGMAYSHDWKQDEKALINYLKYWSVHYPDFEWDDIRRSFVNRESALALTENYERLYRRLNSNNDSVAMQSYLLLTEGDPVEVVGLAKKYKDLLRNYNRSLPDMKYKYLEQLVDLTGFCRRNNVRYKAPARLQTFMNNLGRTKSKKERYFIENQIIERLQLDEVTALEYWGCLNESQLEISFSVGRILDKFYTQNWERIIKNASYLRLYLKKSKLFANIGVIGVCNGYLKKFETLSRVERKVLEDMLIVESDLDIIEQINVLLNGGKPEEENTLIALLEGRVSLTKEALENLPEPNQSELDKIYDYLVDSENERSTKQIWIYLKYHKPLDFTPIAMQLLGQQIEEKATLKWLENMFDYAPKDKRIRWLDLWENRGDNYKKWQQEFFEEQIEKIKTAPELTIKDLNAVTRSKYYHSSLKNTCMVALKKVSPTKDIRRLKLPEPLSIKEDLVFFKDFEFSNKVLDDIPKLFNLKEDLAILIVWVNEKASKFTPEEKGGFYNVLFRSNWFADYVNDDNLAAENATLIKEYLEFYLKESDYLSEFEELETIRNIALIENSDRDLLEKIKASIAIDVDEISRNKIQGGILSRISYSEIPIVVPYLNDLTVIKSYNFLSKDFGLPIYNLTDYEVIQNLLANHKSKSEIEFYSDYLTEFGVDFKENNGNLDFDKIYEILQYDIITPFVGDGGNRRDFYTYGIVKLLELHFNTLLGFHEKLNENQTFYSFSSSKRAVAWRKYLIKKQVVKAKSELTPSFNVSLK
jgi:hypothetical protein